jgi:light-regulated signal transduction histidine kinase (bacteriophytochrome)
MTADEFASLVTHELRNPLNALSGWLHLLSADPAARSDTAQRALAGMQRALDQQVGQIDALGHVLRLSMAAGPRTDAGPLDLDTLLHDVAQALKSAARAAGREIVVHVDASARGARVQGHRAASDAALQAIGRFAIRHGTPLAPLRFELRAGDGETVLRVAVDEGDGAGRSIWSVFGHDGGTRMALELLQATLEFESHGARIGPQGDGRVGDSLQIRFISHDGSAATRTESGLRG